MRVWLRYTVAVAVAVACLFLMLSLTVIIFQPVRPEPLFLAIQFFAVVAGVTGGFGIALRFLLGKILSASDWVSIVVLITIGTGAIIYMVMIGFATPKEALILDLIVLFPLGGWLTHRWVRK